MGYGEVKSVDTHFKLDAPMLLVRSNGLLLGGAEGAPRRLLPVGWAEYRGEPIQRATLVAWDIGICGGKRSYRKLSIDGWKATNICRAY